MPGLRLRMRKSFLSCNCRAPALTIRFFATSTLQTITKGRTRNFCNTTTEIPGASLKFHLAQFCPWSEIGSEQKGGLMDRRLKKILLAPVCLLALSGVSHAQLKDNLEVNLFGGGSLYTKNKFEIGFPQSTRPIQGEFRLSRAVRAGVRVGVFTRGHWSEEFFYSYDPTMAHFARSSAPARSVDLRLRVHNYGVTALYYIHDDEVRNIRPFLSIGVGGAAYLLTPEAKSMARDPLRGNLPGL